MRRIVATALIVTACTALVLIGTAGSNPTGNYEVRAIFDNGGFIVPGEDVRVAGAKVGSVESVDVTDKDETASLQGGAHPVPGKAVVVMQIVDAGFKDFRQDASCLIRPQSLIGEKYVDCEVTQPRAPGTKPPPSLRKVPDGQPGAGQYL
jgi:phospholipid/cholesterol/gamma-HCH transport system substrate-binding protein